MPSIACSALKRAYRDILVHGRDDVRIVFLNGTQELIAGRLAAAQGPFHAAGTAGQPVQDAGAAGSRTNIPSPCRSTLRSRPSSTTSSANFEPGYAARNLMTRIALVVSDVDGTLLTKDKILTDGAQGRGAAAARGRHRLHHRLQPADDRHAVF